MSSKSASFGPSWLQSAPMLRLLLPLVLGIWVQSVVALPAKIWLVVGVLGGIGLVVAQCKPLAWQHRWYWVKGILLQLLLVVLGMAVYTQQVVYTQPAILLQPGINTLRVQLDEPPVQRDKTYKVVATLQYHAKAQKAVEASGKIILYFKKDSALMRLLPALQPGSIGWVQTNVQPIANSGNPGAFDYIAWCHRQGIYYQSFLSAQAITLLPSTPTYHPTTVLWSLRLWVLKQLQHYLPDSEERAVAAALLIGYRHFLDRELVQAYSNVGVVHIIAISGLHLGMIYGLLYFLLAPLERTPRWRPFKYIVMLLVIGLFTAIAGGMPSIARSAVMFSMLILGKWFNRNAPMYNNLAASAFLLLLWQPFNLWDVGFQLSYAAVLGIVVFQSLVLQGVIRVIPWQPAAQLVAVTLSAQVFTTPISWYHFHQFPLYFLLANCWVVPLSGLLLYGLMAVLLFAPFPLLASWLGGLMGKGIAWMNAGIVAIYQWPHAVWGGIQLNSWQVAFIFVAIVGIMVALFQRCTIGIWVSLVALLGFAILRSVDFWTKEQQQKLIVYQVPQQTAIDIIRGRQCQFMGASVYWQAGYLRNFHIEPSRLWHRIQTVQVLDTQLIAPKIITLSHTTILWLNRPIANKTVINTQPPHIIILSQNPNISLQEIIQQWPCRQFVADASNPLWKINQWKKEAEALHLRLHSIPESGAFVVNL